MKPEPATSSSYPIPLTTSYLSSSFSKTKVLSNYTLLDGLSLWPFSLFEPELAEVEAETQALEAMQELSAPTSEGLEGLASAEECLKLRTEACRSESQAAETCTFDFEPAHARLQPYRLHSSCRWMPGRKWGNLARNLSMISFDIFIYSIFTHKTHTHIPSAVLYFLSICLKRFVPPSLHPRGDCPRE